MIAQHPKPENVIVGVRPEHLEDAALIDAYQRIRALTFEVKVDMVESLGADKYVYFTTAGAAVHSAQLAELAAESGVARKRIRRKGSRRVEGRRRAVDRVGVRHHQAGGLRRRHRGEPDHSRRRADAKAPKFAPWALGVFATAT